MAHLRSVLRLKLVTRLQLVSECDSVFCVDVYHLGSDRVDVDRMGER